MSHVSTNIYTPQNSLEFFEGHGKFLHNTFDYENKYFRIFPLNNLLLLTLLSCVLLRHV